MKEKLPKIYKQKIKDLKTKVQNDYYYHAQENKNEEKSFDEIKNLDKKSLLKKVNDILNSKEFIYQADVNIIYKNGENINKKIIGLIGDFMLTKDGEKININDVKNIK